MSRPLRIEYPGAFYHVMNRGLNRNAIFLDEDHDRYLFKKTIGEAVDHWKIKVHAYALMDNHYHLLVETPLPMLSRAMRHIDGVYTQRFNRRHRQDGPLLRGRFKSILVEKESYFLELVRYIHLNGVKAKAFPSPDRDIHCSHWDYLHPRQATPWLSQDLVLSYFQKGEIPPEKELHRFVLKGIPEELEKILSRKKWPAVLGMKSFVASVREKYLKNQSKNTELPQKNRLLKSKAVAPDLILKLASEGEFSNRERRWAAIYFLRSYSFLNLKEIGRLMGESSYKAIQKFLQRNDFRGGPLAARLYKRLAQIEMSHVAT